MSVLRLLLALLALMCGCALVHAADGFEVVEQGRPLVFPRDYGAHPGFRTEWWYVTGWVDGPDGRPLGFQVTFFRSGTGIGANNPSRFAPRQLIFGHAALSDPRKGQLVHDQRSAREGFGLAHARQGDTDVKLERWTMRRMPSGQYEVRIDGLELTLRLTLTPTQPPLLQGRGGYSRKGPRPEHASYYYSEPHLKVEGQVAAKGQALAPVRGSAWLDHEWSSEYLAPGAAGWDWAGINLDNGSALMAFQIRLRSASGQPRTGRGGKLWGHAVLRAADGSLRQYSSDEVSFTPQRMWRSPRTGISYPVAMAITTGPIRWDLAPLQPDQELDSRRSTGAVYWEGAVRVQRDGKPAGRGYLELTGYGADLKM
jgi:predicted secreted hydrolase